MLVICNNNNNNKYIIGGGDFLFSDKTEINLDLTKNTNTNTALAFLKTIYDNLNINDHESEYKAFKQEIDKQNFLNDPIKRDWHAFFKETMLPNIKKIFMELLEPLKILKNTDNWTDGYINFNSYDFTKTIITSNILLKMLFLTNKYIDYMIQTNNYYKSIYNSGDIREKIHTFLWKKIPWIKKTQTIAFPDNRIQGISTNPVFVCRLPTREFIPINEIHSPDNNISYKMNSQYMRFYKYMIDSTPEVGNIYNEKNYVGLQNLYKISDKKFHKLYQALAELIIIAINFNSIINILKNGSNGWTDTNITKYNKHLDEFLTKTQTIYHFHNNIYETNIWLIHEPNLWVSKPFQGFFICRYKKITDDVFF